MSDAELIARLRDWEEHDEGKINDAREAAADRIEALTKERDAWKEQHAAEALGLHVQMQRAEALEAKLAKAVEALEDIVKDCEADYPPSHGAIKYFASATLAEIKGESHD